MSEKAGDMVRLALVRIYSGAASHTILIYITLQGVTVTPFRVIDEINQVMIGAECVG